MGSTTAHPKAPGAGRPPFVALLASVELRAAEVSAALLFLRSVFFSFFLSLAALSAADVADKPCLHGLGHAVTGPGPPGGGGGGHCAGGHCAGGHSAGGGGGACKGGFSIASTSNLEIVHLNLVGQPLDVLDQITGARLLAPDYWHSLAPDFQRLVTGAR